MRRGAHQGGRCTPRRGTHTPNPKPLTLHVTLTLPGLDLILVQNPRPGRVSITPPDHIPPMIQFRYSAFPTEQVNSAKP